MEGKTEETIICPACGQHVTEEDKKQDNVEYLPDGRMAHKKCRIITK